MEPLFRASITCLNSIKAAELPALYNLCRSLTHSTTLPKISLPTKDYSASPTVARFNWMITHLCRLGRVNEARNVFDQMPERDVVTWTTVITGYIKCGLIEEAKQLFYSADAMKNVVTWTAMVGAHVRLKQISEAEKLFKAMPEKNVVSWNTLIEGYVRNGLVDKGLELFERMPERNEVSWNTMITCLMQCGRVEEARRLFDEMPNRNVISWTTMVTGLASNGRVDEAREVFERMPERNVVSWNAMITGYVKNVKLVEAFYLFERMPEKDLVSWNTMITGFIQNFDLKRARNLFDEMPERNVVSWTTMINGYVQGEESELALKMFVEMMRDGRVKPNDGTFVSVLGACSDLAGLSEGQQVHQIISKSTYKDWSFVASALVNMYSKCGDLGMARKMFDGVFIQRDLVCWNSMIAAYAHHGCGKEAIELFNLMKDLGLKPSDVSYIGLLSACSHAGMVHEGLKYFNELVSDRSIQLREEHYTCLVDLCGRAGRLEEAYGFIKQLEIKPSSSIWGPLLAGCHIYGDLKIGRLAAEELLTEEPQNAGTYSLLSNIYATMGNWREAATVRLKMLNKGLKKQPGCSWIEVENKFHVFLVRDKSHCQFNRINCVLSDLHFNMREERYVTNSDFLMDEEFAIT